MRAGADAPDSGRVKESAPWSYDEAFCRNLGLISPTEQQRLRNSRVAIAGMGGVGGIDMVALARMGIGKFTIADPDVFEIRNSNRQYGAMRSTNGQAKAEVMRISFMILTLKQKSVLSANLLGKRMQLPF